MYTLTIILNRLPFAPAALPAFIATIGVSDFLSLMLPPSLFRLVGKCAKKITPRVGSPGLPQILNIRLEPAYDPGWIPLTCPFFTSVILLLAGVQKPSAHSKAVISGLYTFTVGITRYHCSSPVFIPTHQAICYHIACKA